MTTRPSLWAKRAAAQSPDQSNILLFTDHFGDCLRPEDAIRQPPASKP